MQTRIFLGIDPGASGGLAFIETYGDEISDIRCTPMPSTEADIWAWFRDETKACPAVFAMIEQVGGYIGGVGNTGSSMFKFGHSYGLLRMAMIGNMIPFAQVTPQVWQKHYGLATRKNEKKNQYKNRLKAMAQQLFPNLSGITLKTADALLLAEYCRFKKS